MLSDDLIWRGLIKDHTFADLNWLNEPKGFYLGVDAGSADSLTVGNLAAFMLARRLAEAGWKAVLLMGGATSLIGDPGGKDSERDLVSKEQIDSNIEGIKKQVEALFAGKEFTFVNNYDWFKDVGYLQFLREIGKNYSMTELIQRDYITDRMGKDGSGISYAEFSYSLVQAYDYWIINKNHGVVLQIGGSDQWANMISGIPLIRKKEHAEAHALSIPLVQNKTTGKKFGKSEEGAVWLDENKTSVFKFYQFWLNSGDEDIIDYMKVFSLKTKEEIEQVAKDHKLAPQDRRAQKVFALDITAIVHGLARAESVQKISEALFGDGDYKALGADDFKQLENELKTVDKGSGELVDLLVQTELASSKGEARRFLESNAVYINGQQIPLSKTHLDKDDNIHGYAVLRRGKNTTALVRF